MRKFTRTMIWTMMLVLVATGALFAQTSLGRITGRVLDPAGAVIPGCEVVALNEETGISTVTLTNDTGSYAFPALNPGIYRVSASLPGFKAFQMPGIRLLTAQVLELDISMQLGEITEMVTVTDESPLLESTTSTVGQMIEDKTIQEMPLSARRSLNLVALSGAAVFLTGGERSIFSLAGGRSRNQTYITDGGTMQNMRLGVGQNRTDPPVSAVKEFRVVQNSYAAEYGGSASGVIVSTTKSGTNDFHGSAYEFYRNDALDAAYFFAPYENGEKVKAPRRYNLFGGSFGGPIIRNKTHFFAAVEINEHKLGSTDILTVPTALQRQGDFSQTFANNGNLETIYDPLSNVENPDGTVTRTPFPNSVIPSGRIDPVMTQLLSYYPMPNRDPVNLAGAQNFVTNVNDNLPRQAVVIRVDHSFSDDNKFYFRYIFGGQNQQNGSPYADSIADPSGGLNFDRYQHGYLWADNHNWTPMLLMDVRYTYTTRKNHAKSGGLGSSIVEEVGMQGVPGGAFPTVRITGFSNLGNSRERLQFPIGQHQWVNNWTWVRGTHVVKWGWEARQSWNYEVMRATISGRYDYADSGTGQPTIGGSGYALASAMLGFVNSFSLQDQEVLDRYNWYLSWFVQDDWKITPTLTLNLGLRWETDTPITDRNLRFNSFDMNQINPVSGTPGVVKFGGVNGWRESAYDTDWNNFGPRIGFAWRPGGSLEYVFRGGFGVFFEHPFAHGAPASAALGFQLSASDSSQDQGVTPAFWMRDGPTGVSLEKPPLGDEFGAVPVGSKPKQNVTFYEIDRKTGYAMQFNLGVQKQLAGDMVADVSYVGNLARKSPNSNLQMNAIPVEQMGPGNKQALRPFPQFNNVAIQFPMLGVSNYHAGVFKLTKRFSNGFNFLSTYTWSRNIGNIDYSNSGEVGDNALYMDYYNRKLDKGPNAIDIVHRFTFSGVFDLPFGSGRRWVTDGVMSHIAGGWTVSAITNMQSGGPFGVRVQSPKINYASGTPRANIIGDPNLPGDQRTVARWFNTDAFTRPADYTYGDAGRGVVRSDGRVNFDFSINKRFYFSEGINLKFSGEFFNAFNHADFDPPNRDLGNASFGRISGATDARVIQLGLQLTF